MAKGIIRKVEAVIHKIDKELSSQSQEKYVRGLAREGYVGGYQEALMDVLLALNGVTPNRRNWWREE
jgi:hypothetical protein